MRIFLLLFFGLITFGTVGHAESFEEANEMLHAGNTHAAAAAYEQLIAEGIQSSAVCANLGRALQQQGNVATASLYYHRALMLNPRQQVARQGLAELGGRNGIPTFPPRWTDGVIERVSLASLVMVGEVFFWAGAFFLVAVIFRSRCKVTSLIFSTGCLLVGAFLLGMSRWGDPRIADANLAIVISDRGSSAFHQPVETSSLVASLPPGSPVAVLSEQGNWNYCQLANGSTAWMAASSLSFVNPEHKPGGS